MPLDIAIRAWCGEIFVVIDVAGEIDAETCGVFRDALRDVARTQRAVVVDLTRVRLLSAAGLHCLDGFDQEGGHSEVYLVCPESSIVRTVLKAVPLRRLPVYPDVVRAVESVTGSAPLI